MQTVLFWSVCVILILWSKPVSDLIWFDSLPTSSLEIEYSSHQGWKTWIRTRHTHVFCDLFLQLLRCTLNPSSPYFVQQLKNRISLGRIHPSHYPKWFRIKTQEPQRVPRTDFWRQKLWLLGKLRLGWWNCPPKKAPSLALSANWGFRGTIWRWWGMLLHFGNQKAYKK